jgi:hypothetical protein
VLYHCHRSHVVLDDKVRQGVSFRKLAREQSFSLLELTPVYIHAIDPIWWLWPKLTFPRYCTWFARQTETETMIMSLSAKWSLKPGVKVSMPSYGWSLGRFGGSAIGTSTIGRPWCRWPSRWQSSTRPGLGHARASSRLLASWASGLWVLCSAFLFFMLSSLFV